MKLKAIIKEDKKPISKEDKFIGAILFTSEMIINTIVPFVSGILLHNTKNILWIIPLIIIVIVRIRIEYQENKFTINIVRKI